MVKQWNSTDFHEAKAILHDLSIWSFSFNSPLLPKRCCDNVLQGRTSIKEKNPQQQDFASLSAVPKIVATRKSQERLSLLSVLYMDIILQCRTQDLITVCISLDTTASHPETQTPREFSPLSITVQTHMSPAFLSRCGRESPSPPG